MATTHVQDRSKVSTLRERSKSGLNNIQNLNLVQDGRFQEFINLGANRILAQV